MRIFESIQDSAKSANVSEIELIVNNDLSLTDKLEKLRKSISTVKLAPNGENELINLLFSFSSLSFSNFIFSSDKVQKIMSTKLRIKKVDSTSYRLFNSELNEPFGIFDIALEYVENGNHK